MENPVGDGQQSLICHWRLSNLTKRGSDDAPKGGFAKLRPLSASMGLTKVETKCMSATMNARDIGAAAALDRFRIPFAPEYRRTLPKRNSVELRNYVANAPKSERKGAPSPQEAGTKQYTANAQKGWEAMAD